MSTTAQCIMGLQHQRHRASWKCSINDVGHHGIKEQTDSHSAPKN